jgi:putative nucleotidyltransferase with HDIG domain
MLIELTQRHAIIDQINNLDGLPASASQLIRKINDPDINIQEIVDSIEVDPALTASVLKWANSAAFCGIHEIATIRDAAVRLGLQKMRALITASLTSTIMSHAIPEYDLSPGQLLERSIVVGMGSVEIAKSLQIEIPEYTFTAGLLHDIGKIVLGKFVGNSSATLLHEANREAIPFNKAEQNILGIDHAEAGALLLDRWNIPAPIVEVVRWHHEPDLYEGGPHTPLDVIHITDLAATCCGLGVGIEGVSNTPSPMVLHRLEITQFQFEQCILILADTAKQARQFLEVA